MWMPDYGGLVLCTPHRLWRGCSAPSGRYQHAGASARDGAREWRSDDPWQWPCPPEGIDTAAAGMSAAAAPAPRSPACSCSVPPGPICMHIVRISKRGRWLICAGNKISWCLCIHFFGWFFFFVFFYFLFIFFCFLFFVFFCFFFFFFFILFLFFSAFCFLFFFVFFFLFFCSLINAVLF